MKSEVEMKQPNPEVVFVDPAKLAMISDQQVVNEYLRGMSGSQDDELLFGPRLSREVRKLVLDLSEKDQRLLHYKVVCGLSEIEVSQKLGIPVFKVRRALPRILRGLRNSLLLFVENQTAGKGLDL